MKCPVCDVNLVIADRAGVEIDYCPQCRGVWLDRGELDKIIERSGVSAPRPQAYEERRPTSSSDHDHDHDRTHGDEHDRDNYGRRPQNKKERGGFLGDLFDF